MGILAFETSAKAASVALLEGGNLLAESYQNAGLTHSRTILVMAEHLLQSCELTPQDVEAVAVAMAQSRSILMARMQADMVQTGAFAAAEFATFAKAGLFANWAASQTYAKGYRLAHKGIVYEVMQEVTAIENQPPDAAGMLAVYRPLSVDPETGEEPDGSREHPFAFLYGMDVTKDSYYTYEGKLWLARADMPACVWVPGTAGLWQWEEASAA